MRPRFLASLLLVLAAGGCDDDSESGSGGDDGAPAEAGSGSETDAQDSADEMASLDDFDAWVLGNSFRALVDNGDGQREGAILSFVEGQTPSLWVQLSGGGVTLVEWEIFINSYDLELRGNEILLSSGDLGFEASIGAESLSAPLWLEISFRALGPDSIEVNLNDGPAVLEPLPFEDDWRSYERDEYVE